MEHIDLPSGNIVLLGDKQHIHRRRKFDNNRAASFENTIIPKFSHRYPDPVYFDIQEAVMLYMGQEEHNSERAWIPEQTVVAQQAKQHVKAIEYGGNEGQLLVRYEAVKEFSIKNPLSSNEEREFKITVGSKSGWMPASVDPVADNVWVTESSKVTGYILNAYVCNGAEVTESFIAGSIINVSDIKRSTVVMSRCVMSSLDNCHITASSIRNDCTLINLYAIDSMFEQSSINACNSDSVNVQRSNMVLSYIAQSLVMDSELSISNCIGVDLREDTKVVGSTLREVNVAAATFLSSDITLFKGMSVNFIERRKLQ